MVERRNTSMHSKPLEPHELDKIATVTLAYYEQHAGEFRGGTRDHDVSQNIASLLRYIEGDLPFTILDFGCGPGRDLLAVLRDGAALDPVPVFREPGAAQATLLDGLHRRHVSLALGFRTIPCTYLSREDAEVSFRYSR